jgi:mRNA-degrading endonuclease RelE of RelBE toxin-antitoxin system
MIIQIKKSVFKEVSKLPRRIQILYSEFLSDLEKDGLNIQGWDLIKLSGSANEYRAKLNRSYRVILQYVNPDIIIIKVAAREGVYK